MSFKSIPINAYRVIDGLSKIGYTPQSALCDIIDNSVQAKAKNIWLNIVREAKRSDNVKNNVKEYVIIDDGKGMDETGMISSLELGSTDKFYEGDSLSKFGLGLKSASFSQSDELQLISRNDVNSNFIKYQVSIPMIKERNEYGIEIVELDEYDKELITKYLENKTGTIVRLSSVRKTNHPPIKKTLEHLETRVGIIYFYFMLEDGLNIYLSDKICPPKDPLFVDEANENGNLDELKWDGLSVRWIQRPTEIIIDAENEVKAKIEVTNLVHPPSFKLKFGGGEEGERQRIKAREKYNISSGNYGYYVYRNKRLISWAECFDGMIPLSEQDLYAFRGRIIIDTSADDCVNIDVKKSRIQLSDEAYDTIDNITSDYKRKSKKAWSKTFEDVKEATTADERTVSNSIAASTKFPDELPGEKDDAKTLEEKNRREKKLEDFLLNSQKENENLNDSNQNIEGNDVTNIDTKIYINESIQLVDRTTDNLLWEMYHDAELGTVVRINKHHRFSKLIYNDLLENKQLNIIIDNLFFTLVQAEKHVIKTYQNLKDEQIISLLQNFREIASQYLTKTAQSIDKEIGNYKL